MRTTLITISLAIALSGGVSVAVAQSGGWSELRAAIFYGRDAEVVRLLDSGADVNMQNEEGWTPLMIAAEAGDFDLVKLLLARGADPSIQSRRGYTATSVATTPEIKQLLSANGDRAATPAKPSGFRAPGTGGQSTAKAPAGSVNQCSSMYAQAYKMCGTSDWACKSAARVNLENCKVQGSWYPLKRRYGVR